MPESVRLDMAIERYLRHRKANGLAVNTIRTDNRVLLGLVTEVGNIYVKTLEAKHVDNYLAAAAGNWSDGSVNLARASLSAFFKYCRSSNWLPRDRDPLHNMNRRKLFAKQRSRVPVSKFPDLLDATKHPRDRMVIALGLFLFLRASEMKMLRIKDVHLDVDEISVVVPKSRLEDAMPITEHLRIELVRWLTWYTAEVGELRDDYYLVPSKLSQAGTYNRATGRLEPTPGAARLRPERPVAHPQNVCQRALHELGYPTYREGVHTLRRSGARALFDELCEKGYDRALDTVSTMLHHKEMGTTQLYLGLDESRKRRDDLLKGKPMFSNFGRSATVVPIRSVGSR